MSLFHLTICRANVPTYDYFECFLIQQKLSEEPKWKVSRRNEYTWRFGVEITLTIYTLVTPYFGVELRLLHSRNVKSRASYNEEQKREPTSIEKPSASILSTTCTQTDTVRTGRSSLFRSTRIYSIRAWVSIGLHQIDSVVVSHSTQRAIRTTRSSSAIASSGSAVQFWSYLRRGSRTLMVIGKHS